MNLKLYESILEHTKANIVGDWWYDQINKYDSQEKEDNPFSMFMDEKPTKENFNLRNDLRELAYKRMIEHPNQKWNLGTTFSIPDDFKEVFEKHKILPEKIPATNIFWEKNYVATSNNPIPEKYKVAGNELEIVFSTSKALNSLIKDVEDMRGKVFETIENMSSTFGERKNEILQMYKTFYEYKIQKLENCKQDALENDAWLKSVYKYLEDKKIENLDDKKSLEVFNDCYESKKDDLKIEKDEY